MATIIAHLDMDAFFASIEERDHPRLAGMPIVVGADPLGGRGRGVVSTANYPARAYGIRSALPISRAWRFSEDARRRGLPPAVFMDVDMEKYAAVSRRVMAMVAETVADASGRPAVVAQASVDEAYIDLSFCSSYEDAAAVARRIKDAIREGERLTASVGVGPNKLIAKIASDFQKPDGLTVVPPERAADFIAPMAVRKIPGVGPKTEAQLARLGVRTVADARRFSEPELYGMMGKWGVDLYAKLRGRSDEPIYEEAAMKSVSEQATFAHDVPVGGAHAVRDRKVLTDALAAIADDVAARVRAEGPSEGFSSFRAVGITVRFADFTTRTRVVTLPKKIAVDDVSAGETLRFQSLRLFMPFLDRRENPEHKAIRLLGVRAERLA
jgi:DNA polymerase IV (archaeal DinB-like DNA polymerase)